MSECYKVSGMTCGGCARAVEQALKTAVPAAVVQVDLAAAAVTVDGIAAEVVRLAVENAGFGFEGAV